jgi:hypothetical protein
LMNEPAVFGCEHDDDVERRRLDRGLHWYNHKNESETWKQQKEWRINCNCSNWMYFFKVICETNRFELFMTNCALYMIFQL